MVCRSGFCLRRRANEGELLDPCDVVWIRAMQIRAWGFLLVQLDQYLLFQRLRDQKIVFALGSIAPKNILGLGQELDFVHPIKHGLIRWFVIADSGGRRNGRRGIVHKCMRSGDDVDLIDRAGDEFPSLPPLLQEFFRWFDQSGAKSGRSVDRPPLRSEKRGRLFSMFGVTTSDDYRPVAWMGRFPVDVTTILVGIHVALAIVACLLVAAGGGGLLDLMMFDSARVLESGQVWRLATYAFIHSPIQLLWFAIEMYMLFVFGREVEKFIGQRAYIVLYAVLLSTPSLLLTLWGFSQRTGLAGSLALHFGVFVAFATIYPSAELLLRITAK